MASFVVYTPRRQNIVVNSKWTKLSIQLLLDNSERNIDLNARNDYGWTAFIMACKCGSKDVVKLLVEHSKTRGIDIFKRTRGVI